MRGRGVKTAALLACTFALTNTSALAGDGGTEYDSSPRQGGTEYGSPLKKLPKPKEAKRQRKHSKRRPKAKPKRPEATPPAPPTPGSVATLVDGVAHAPSGAPREVVLAIDAGNRLQGKPYRYGGGHKELEDTAYDCSGTVSYALNGAGLLESPLDSGSLMNWGEAGPGSWITVYANKGHTYVVIAGLRLDTSRVGADAPAATISRRRDRVELGTGPLWQVAERPSEGFEARHPAGL